MPVSIGIPNTRFRGMGLLDISDNTDFLNFLKYAHKKLSGHTPCSMNNVIWLDTESRTAGVLSNTDVRESETFSTSNPKIVDYLTVEQSRYLGDHFGPIYVVGNAAGVQVILSSSKEARALNLPDSLTDDDVWHILDSLVSPRPKHPDDEVWFNRAPDHAYLHYYCVEKAHRTAICVHPDSGFALTITRNTP